MQSNDIVALLRRPTVARRPGDVKVTAVAAVCGACNSDNEHLDPDTIVCLADDFAIGG